MARGNDFDSDARHGVLFDAWDIDAMVVAFLPDSVSHHTHGVSRGKVETRRFFQEQCHYVVPGVSRQALNPIVDPDDDDQPGSTASNRGYADPYVSQGAW